MESFILFYEKCRLCLDQPGTYNMFEKEEWPQDIYFCTGVKVHRADNLPQKICISCCKIVARAKQLRILAGRNDIHLRTLFDGYDSESQLQIDEDRISSSGSKSQDIRTDDIGKSADDMQTNMESCSKKPQLQIDENRISSSGTKSQDKRTDDIRKSADKTQTSRNMESCSKKSNSNKAMIAVRKDLLQTPAVVSSSTKTDNDSAVPEPKRIKVESQSNVNLECETCKKTFQTPKKLYHHRRMHNKSIACPLDVCGKMFATKGDLEKHFRTHTGEKPFPCNSCDRSFAQRGALKAHRQTVHHDC